MNNELLSLANYSLRSSYGHQTWGIGSFSIEDDLIFNNISIPKSELETLYRNSNLISNIINYFPDQAEHYGYRLLDVSGTTVAERDLFITQAFKEASIKARLLGKSYLVINPDTNDPIDPIFSNNKFRVYEKLIKVENFWINKKHKTISFDAEYNKKIEVTEKQYPDSNVFPFFGKRTYIDDVDIDDEDYSDSVLKGLFTEYKNYIISNEFARKILQNLSNLTISVKGLSLQLKSVDMQSRIERRLALLDQNRATSNAILHDDNEKIDYIKQNLDNVTEFIESLKNILVSYTDIPSEKLFGYSSGSGYWTHIIIRQMWSESIQQWIMNNWLSNLQKLYTEAGYQFEKIVVPINIILTELEKAELEEKAANRSKILVETGIISRDEARNAYKYTDFTLNIVLDENGYGSGENSELNPISDIASDRIEESPES